jgi:hypothetical protein
MPPSNAANFWAKCESIHGSIDTALLCRRQEKHLQVEIVGLAVVYLKYQAMYVQCLRAHYNGLRWTALTTTARCSLSTYDDLDLDLPNVTAAHVTLFSLNL